MCIYPPHISAYVYQNVLDFSKLPWSGSDMYIQNVHQHINIQINKSIMIYSDIGIVGNNKK